MFRPPIIAKSAIKAFLERPRKDSDKAKLYSSSELDSKIDELFPRPRFATKPRKHQKVSFLFCAHYSGFLLYLDMGLGKTWVVLNAFQWRKRAGEASRMLAVVPNVSNVLGWEEQVNEHTPRLTYAGVAGDSSDKRGAMSSEADVLVMTYASFLRMVTSDVEVVDSKGRKKIEWKIDPEKIKRVGERFQFLALDECTFIKNHLSETFKAVLALRQYIRFCYGMAGVPFGRNPADLWAQFKAVDGGETLGETLGVFRAAFFTPKRNHWSGGFDWKFDPKHESTLNRIIRHRSISYECNDCQDLPPLTRLTRTVKFDSETLAYHERLIADLQRKDSHFKAESSFHQMRQITAGYLGVKDPEGERIDIQFKRNPKMDALVADLQAMPLGAKAIVFNVYTNTGELICQRLKEEKIRHVRLYGGTSNKAEVLKKFKADPNCRVLVLQAKAGAYGLNLQHATYTMYYESPVSPIDRDQGDKRSHRTGQTQHCFIIDYIVRGSVDAKIQKYLAEGKDLQEAIMRNPLLLAKD